jgi:glyoxylase-like metal-dependent hydrolase (beta-lactamase superfamily II)
MTHPTPALAVRAFAVGPILTNAYLVACEATREAVLIDPGDEADVLIDGIRAAGVSLHGLYATHAHFDHVGAVEALKRAFSVPFRLHRDGLFWLDRLEAQAAHFGLPAPERPKPDGFVAGGDRFRVGRIEFEVLHVPGHAPGHVVFYAPSERAAFVGDVLFAGSIGRTDLPGGDPAALADGIRTKLFPLGDDVRCFPGHGPATTIGAERRNNPFVGCAE